MQRQYGNQYLFANSPLVGQITFANNGITRMTTTKQYDFLNRLTAIESRTGVSPAASFVYSYNSANQRTLVTNVDNSYSVYQNDFLGQVTSGKKYWSDGTPVAAQQNEYTFDDIGNRKTTASGGDAVGSSLRLANYSANSLNQYTSRDVPGYATIMGSANPNATVTVNLQRAYRHGNYFQDELGVNNSSSALWLSLTNLAVLNNGTNADIVATNIGNVLLPMTPETFGYDSDGNMTNSGRWTITWDAENRATSFTSLSSAPSPSRKKVDCAYDYRGRGIQKIVSTNSGSAWIPVSTNRFVYDGWNLVAILDSQSSILVSFQWGTDVSGTMQGAGGVGGLISMTVYSGTNAGTYFYAYDGNGNVAALVNAANGIISVQYDYDPCLGIARASGALALVNPFLGSTKFYDWETGLYYYGYRYYDPSTGRWPNKDPLGDLAFVITHYANSSEYELQKLEAQALLPPYLFVQNNAVNSFDPFGLYNNCCCDHRGVEAGKNLLIGRYDVALGYLESRGVPHGKWDTSDYSCWELNSKIFSFIAPYPHCWTCSIEHRFVYHGPFHSFGREHYAIVCKSHPLSGSPEEILFDYWGNRSAGENPNAWFRSTYSTLLETYDGSSFTDCSKPEKPGMNYNYLNIIPPAK